MSNSSSNKTIPLFKVFMSSTAAFEASKVLNSGYIGEGQKVKDFEKALRKHFDVSSFGDIITCNSATSAEHLIYHILKGDINLELKVDNALVPLDWKGIKSDEHVLTTPLTCTATNWPILLNGHQIRWVDVDPNTMNMDLADLESKINEKTRVVQLVHWGGYPNDLDEINRIVRNASLAYDTNIIIVEDCAHAFGSLYKNTPVGFSGNISTFSLQAIKHITSIDGGFIHSPFHNFSKKARLLRWYGIDREAGRTDFRCEGDIPEIGFKFHMNDVNATVGIENLKSSSFVLNQHRSNGSYYNRKLQNVDGVTLLDKHDWADSAYWLYTMKVDRRDDFMKKMAEHGIMVSRVHERNDKHSSVAQYKVDLPKMESFIDNMICIPVGWWVDSQDREFIVDKIKEGW